MERIRIGVLVVIAIALVRIAFGPVWGEAHAAGQAIHCEVFHADQVGNMKKERAVESARGYAATVKAWLETHPGDPLFRTTLVNEPFGHVDIVCVR